MPRNEQLIWKYALPLAIISFGLFTKWWYVLPVDAPDTMMSGFPLIWVADGWHTSLSFQFFLLEGLFNFSVYLLFWVGLILAANRFLDRIPINKYVAMLLWTPACILIAGGLLVATTSHSLFYLKRDYDVTVMVSGYTFIWQAVERPDFHTYDPRKQQEDKE